MSILEPLDDDRSSAERIARADRIKALLDDDVFKEAKDEIERHLIRKMLRDENPTNREEARCAVLLLASFEEILQGIVNDGIKEIHAQR